jgi:ubiquinone/menaquinone biosynthesis C-methylase UbiE
MDDKNFDQATALDWIRIIEDSRANVREQDLYPLLKSWLSRSHAKNVLDIGCGQGICSVHLGETNAQYVGVDPSSDLIHRANELYSSPSRSFATGNIYNLPFKDKSFGAAFSIAVWHLLSDISKASSELNRVLEDKGSFLIVTADPAQYQGWMERYEKRELKASKFVGINQSVDGSSSSDTLYLHTLDEIIEALEKQSFKVSTIQTVRSFVAILGQKS